MRGDVEKAIEILWNGTPGALEQAVGVLQDTVFSFCMKVCGSRANAEDCSQEVMLHILPRLRKFRSARALRVYLYKAAKTRCLMSRRRSKYAPPVRLSLEELSPDRADLNGPICCGGDDPERSLLETESRRRLEKALFGLPPAYRAILALHDMEGLPTGEVADVMALRPGTVRVRLHRARAILRREFEMPARRSSRARSGTRRRSDCRRLIATLSDYLEEVIDPGLCGELDGHLENCDPCRSFLKSLEKTVEMIRHFPVGRLPRHEAARIRSGILAEYGRAMQAARRGRRPHRSRN